MKLIATLLTATMLVASVFAQDCDLQFVPNPDLARDCVELAVTAENFHAFTCIYSERGINRPDWPDAVQVAIYVSSPEGVLRFLGWGWMTADEANLMHKPAMASL
jgi:hypothetical protein